ncbi:GNAT family N-acetyltransferase [uncultured Microbacterium sp.]|uniref:GNAT family N-acetyltransferase n=1 Tax=uncultured Microbacterium sp. TaxID=191216 RepID=UPI0026196C67|nr:GNAT family N-acetyltransferase [uncultured Microbacterium sp.]
MPDVRVTMDLADIDLDFVHRWLSEHSYWARGRSRDVVEKAARASLNFGAVDAEGRLVGYARVGSDQVTFAWLCDVFVDPAVRGLGAGKALVAAVVEVTRSMRLRRMLLSTGDAHELYAQFGFEPIAEPVKFMALIAG